MLGWRESLCLAQCSLKGSLLLKIRADACGVFAGRVPVEYGTLLLGDMIRVNPRSLTQPAVSAWVRKHGDLFTKD